jgi:hypothetical protein
MSALVYGNLALIVGAEAAPWRRFAVAGMGGAAVIGIALSRVALGAHSLSEVVLGLAIGGTALAFFARSYLEVRPRARQIGPFLAAVALLMLLLHGRSAHLEDVWHDFAAYLHDNASL